jgi:hypothetical protein
LRKAPLSHLFSSPGTTGTAAPDGGGGDDGSSGGNLEDEGGGGECVPSANVFDLLHEIDGPIGRPAAADENV